MKRFRCKTFDDLSAMFDRQISFYRDRATTHAKDHTARMSEGDLLAMRGRKARALNGHLRRCPVCR